MSRYDLKCKVIEEELKSVWPEWHVVCRLGGGAFGDVYQICRDNYGIRVDSALKVIQVSSDNDTADISFSGKAETRTDIPDSFRSEIQIMELLRGAPNIVSIEDFYYKRDGLTSCLFVRMELLTSIQKVLSGRDGHHNAFSIREICKMGRDICTALMYCEKKGIIHRDIKPANLFVDKFGNYKVGDFGVSKRMDTVHLARTMTGIGTISYMAPEIFRGCAYNNTVDIYALGLVLYQLFNNGRMPFLPAEGTYTMQDSDSANYRRLHGELLPDLTGKNVGEERIDSRLDAVVRKACAVDPCDRYQTAKEFYDALDLTETAEKKSRQEDIKRLHKKEKHPGENKPRKTVIRSGGNIPMFFIAFLFIAVAVMVVLHTGRRPVPDSWEDIIAAGEDGTYIEKYKIGYTKELDLGKKGVIEMELVAFDADELADGSGKAAMTWIAMDLLNTEHTMNEEDTNEGGWPSSDMRTWLQESVLPLFPETVRSNIREVKKYSYSYYDYGMISSSDKIWIPSRSEVFESDDVPVYEGPNYMTAFSSNTSRQRGKNGVSGSLRWWLRCASDISDSSFCFVYPDGSHWGSINANHKCGVAIGFCLGSSNTSSTKFSGDHNRAPGTISDSWEDIIAAVEDGTYLDKYKIGDTKKLNLGEEGVIEMELVAFDADELADGSGKASMTWIAKDLLNTEYPMNQDDMDDGGWPASDLRSWLRFSVIDLFPETLSSNIREVKKYSYSLTNSATITSSDTIWIPSGREIFGEYNSYEDEGPEYTAAFPTNASRQKARNGVSQSWWSLRSTSLSHDGTFLYVDDEGFRQTGNYGDDDKGVAIGFCL